MNQCFRLVWNATTSTWQAVAETASGSRRGASAARRMRRHAAGVLLANAVLAAGAIAQPGAQLPTGGQVAAGTGSIARSGNTLTVQQATNRLALDWQSFSIGTGHGVNFVQPSAQSVALNRVLGSDPSLIQGALRSNGQVFLLNPNGVLFSSTARVDVGGIVASTLNLGNGEFMAGRYSFAGDSTQSVVNQGQITAARGGAVALIAARVENQGQIDATAGQVLMGAGQTVLLDLGAPVKLQVQRGALDALVANGGAIQADGGLVYLTAQSLNALTNSAVNNTGVIRAQTLATGEKGEIRLMGDMRAGTVSAGGTLDASAPNGGDGGFIETSAAGVKLQPGVLVSAGAARGKGGEWLIDPTDITITAVEAAAHSTTLSTGTDVRISTASVNGDAGDITVAADGAITKSAGSAATLTLRADRNININAPIESTVTGGRLNIVLSAANAAGATEGGIMVNANLTSNGGNILLGGGATVVKNALQQAVTSNEIGYALNHSGFVDGSANVSAAISLRSGAQLRSGGGDIVMNGNTSQSDSSLSGGLDKAGIRFSPGTAIYDNQNQVYTTYAPTLIDTGGGNLVLSGVSTALPGGSNKVWGISFLGGSTGDLTSITTGTSRGHIVLDADNKSARDASLSMQQSGGRETVMFFMPSVAHLLPLLQGTLDVASYTYNGSLNAAPYEFSGTLEIPGSNASYKYATYNVTTEPTTPVYGIYQGARPYDGTTNAPTATLSQVAYLNEPTNFSTVYPTSNLEFATYNKNAGTYNSMSVGYSTLPGVKNPLSPVPFSGTDYSVEFFGSYRITPKAISVTAQNKVYDGTFSAALGSPDLVTGDAVTFGYNLATSGFVSKNVGTGIAVTANDITLSGNDAVNYTVGTSVSTTADITRRPVVVTADDKNRAYGAVNPTLTVSTAAVQGNADSGLVSGESLSGLPATTATQTSAVGGYPITQGGVTNANNGNYSITFNNGTLTINKATLGLSMASTYNGTGTYTTGGGATILATGLANGETLNGVTVNQLNVDDNGTNRITGFAGNGTAALSNYDINPARNATLTGTTPVAGATAADSTNLVTLTRAPLGVSVSGTYNGTATLTAAGGATITTAGLVGQDANLAMTSATLNAANVADATRVVSVAGPTPFLLSNYVLNGSANATPSVTAGASADGSAATNAVSMARATLGLSLNATYNGTSTYTAANGATVRSDGLQNNETLNGVTVDQLNVADNGTNRITGFAGTGTAVLGNYAINPGRNASLTGTNPTAGATAALSTNLVTLTPAPLGVSVVGSYNGTPTLTAAGGATITTAGLVGQDANLAMTSATLDAASVALATKVVSVAGPTPFQLSNYVLNGSANATPLVTAGAAADGTEATNALSLSRAVLGLSLNATYNGTGTYTAANGATVQATGLVNNETLNGVTVNQLNVADNGTNRITGFAGTGTADLGNYAINPARNATLSGSTPVAGASAAAATNLVALTPAPLGVSVSGTYNASPTLTTAGGATITTAGLVGQDANLALTSATLDSANVLQATKVLSVAGPSPFLPGNYVLNGNGNATPSVTAGAAADGTGATNAVTLTRAALGIEVTGTYNGTRKFRADEGAQIEHTGLQGTDTLTGVWVDTVDVAGNATNFITGFASGTALLSNYRVSGARNNSEDTTHNVATINRAPLNVQLQATYSGSTTVTPAAGSTYVGWVDALGAADVTSATLSSKNVAANTTNHVTGLSGANGPIAVALGGTVTLTSATGGNYFLNGGVNTPASADANGKPVNTATLGKAAIGVEVSGTYNGGKTFSTATGATITATTLLGTDTLTAVKVDKANVASNGANFVTDFVGGTATLDNYAITNGYSATAGSGRNLATISRAPLEVALQATYSGTTTVTPDAGSAYGGWVDNLTGASVTSATLADKNVAGNDSNSVIHLDGANGRIATALGNGVTLTSNQGGNYFLNGGLNTLASADANGNPVNTATLGKAPLGIEVLSKYNGTGTYTVAGGATLHTAGLLNGETLQGVTIAQTNVADNPTNRVTGFAGEGTALVGNYAINPARNATLAGGNPVASATTANSTNLVTLSAAPLGVSLSAVYNGTDTYTAAGGATVLATGLVNGETLNGVTVAQPNVADNGSNRITGFAGTGSAVLGNYVVNVDRNTTLADGSPVAGATAAASTNLVALSPAPLGVSVSGRYNGTTTLSTAGGATITADGLVGQDAAVALSSATLDAASVARATKVISVAGPGPFDLRNYVLNGNANATPAVTAGASADGTQATNAVSLDRATLGLSLDAVYNGTDSYTTAAGATLLATGLQNGETLEGVTVDKRNVADNAVNRITGFAGAGTADLGNYAINPARDATLADGKPVAGATAAASTNQVALQRAPLGVTVSGTYNGSTTLTAAGGATLRAAGLVGQDAAIALSSATLNAAQVNSATKVVAVAGPGPFDPRNYVLNGSALATASLTAGAQADGSAATNGVTMAPAPITVAADSQRKLEYAPDPALSYRVVSGGLIGSDAFTGALSRAPGEAVRETPYAIGQGSLANPNYAITFQGGGLLILPPEVAPPPPPIIVPVFIDNAVQALPPVQAQAPVQGLLAFGGLNYVLTPSFPLAAALPATNVGALNTGTPTTGGATTAGASGTGTPGATSADGTDAAARKAAGELNINNVTVPSASGPLNVYVVGAGINQTGVVTLKSLVK